MIECEINVCCNYKGPSSYHNLVIVSDKLRLKWIYQLHGYTHYNLLLIRQYKVEYA